MKTFLKIIFWIIVVLIVAYCGYFIYTKWMSGEKFPEKKIEQSIENAKDLSNYVASKTKESITEKAGNYARGVVSEALSSVAQKVNNFAIKISGEPEQSINSFASDSSSNTSTTFPDTISVSGSEYEIPPPFAALITEVGQPLAFSIQNRGYAYSINWGDGIISDGIVSDTGIAISSHIWQSKGDYSVKVDVKENGAQKYFYTLPVRVYEK